jgi:hypothetical protein
MKNRANQIRSIGSGSILLDDHCSDVFPSLLLPHHWQTQRLAQAGQISITSIKDCTLSIPLIILAIASQQLSLYSGFSE